LRVLLIGSGGRESALAYALRKSKLLTELKVYPGNGGFPQSERIPKEAFNSKDKSSTINYIKESNFDFVIIGPEDPLVDGIVDWLTEESILCFGPSQYCANLEGSKEFAKSIMKEFQVPTASYESFTEYSKASEYVQSQVLPIVIKADGLAAGKGVTVAFTYEDANKALKDIFLDKKFDMHTIKVVIEEFMDGEEASVFAISDGEDFVLFPAAQDHKRAYDGDKGPNTGGMGAYAPAPIVNDIVLQKVKDSIFKPMLKGLKSKGHPYKGLLYAGLMIKDDSPRVVEFNCRFGDPETQGLMLLLEDDLLEVMLESARGSLKRKELSFNSKFATVVVLAAQGYPDTYIKNIELESILNGSSDINIFHAGTEIQNHKVVSTGGRVICIAASGSSLKESVSKCYQYLDQFKVNPLFYRKDIAGRAL
jgi:phosphoribosylamine---glycine ligase